LVNARIHQSGAVGFVGWNYQGMYAAACIQCDFYQTLIDYLIM
jgi:hypothetical protein